MSGSTSNLKIVGPVGNIGGGGGLNIIGKYPDDINADSKPGDALIDKDGNIWVFDGTDWIKVDAAAGPPGPPGPKASVDVGTTTTGDAGTDADVEDVGDEDGSVLNFTIPRGDQGEAGEGVQAGGLENEVLAKSSADDFDTKWVTVDFSGGNLVDLDLGRKAAKRQGRNVFEVPTDKVVMYVGQGTPGDWDDIADAKTGSLFTSSSGEGLWNKDSDWDLVGGSEEINTDDFLTADDLDGLATEEYVDEAFANIEIPDGGGSFFGENPPTEDLKEGDLFINSDTYRQYVYDGSVWIEVSPAGVDDSGIDDILKTLNPFVDVEPASITGELSQIYRGNKTSLTYLYSGIRYKSNAIGYSQYRFDVDVLGDGNWVDYNDLPSETRSELVFSKNSSGNNISCNIKIADHGGDIDDPDTYPQPGYENLLIRYWAKNVVNDREELGVSEGISPWVVNHVQYPDVYPDAGGAE